ncbi:KH domain-containing, RNA-binding, signal transduction-associated protein 2-like isoform X2 [Pectinophora gossypiella]|nr:KH domain-containing, RNA-binding, signal transduction-associated protein 2-like isoform X2 [Pectinophora gossypiella]
MADNYESNGYNSSDFKRNSNQNFQGNDSGMGQGGEESKLNDKADEYMRDLLAEKIKLNNAKFPISCKLIDQEVSKVQTTGKIPAKDSKYMDVFREKPARVAVKVLVPVKEFPKFNFIGQLLGPKGNTMKRLQEETMCKMAVLGRGSMRDRQKEEELRNSLDPKYAHLSDELHVEISAMAPPAEAHARIAHALAEVKKYLIPDTDGMLRQTQMRDLMERPPRLGPPGRPQRMPPPPMPMGRQMPPKPKVASILDRARTAMEPSYSYDDPYAAEPSSGYSSRAPPRAAAESDYFYERNDRYYDEEPYYKEAPPAREFKPSARDVGTRRSGPVQRSQQHFARPGPYGRPK